jgi:hypothetical protein
VTQLPCEKRRFPLKLDWAYVDLFEGYLLWYRSLLIRLGIEATHSLWHSVFDSGSDNVLDSILAANWEPVSEKAGKPLEARLNGAVEKQFALPVNSVTGTRARALAESAAPLPQMRAAYPDLAVQKDISTYDALHLMRHYLARLAEELMDQFGKAGDLIAYDILLEEIRLANFKPMTVAEFIAMRKERFSEAPKTLDWHSAGLDVDLINVTDTEIVTHVTHCEWARYYRDHHPRVGYMLACSRDDAAYHAMNPSLHLQRTTTLMEGGDKCDFRIFATAPSED